MSESDSKEVLDEEDGDEEINVDSVADGELDTCPEFGDGYDKKDDEGGEDVDMDEEEEAKSSTEAVVLEGEEGGDEDDNDVEDKDGDSGKEGDDEGDDEDGGYSRKRLYKNVARDKTSSAGTSRSSGHDLTSLSMSGRRSPFKTSKTRRAS